MKVNKILEMGFVDDETEIFIRNREFKILRHGNWYEDYIMDYAQNEVESFTWQDDNKLYIDVK